MALAGSLAALAPIAPRAQTLRRVPRIGYLMDRSGPPGVLDEGFLSGLREQGHVIGQTIAIEYRWTDGKSERLLPLARELAASKVDLIVVAGAESVLAAKTATDTIPIVMASSQDAVGDGLVASLARPGGNVTGQTVYAPELTSKRMELLKEVVAGLTRVGVLWNKENHGATGQLREAQAAGRSLAVAVEPLDARIPEGLDETMARAVQLHANAILIISDSSTISSRAAIGSAALAHNLATMFSNKAYLSGGGLMSYGPDIVDTFRRSTSYVDKILKGAKPAELPVELPTRFEFAINRRTANALRIALSPALAARVDFMLE